MRVFVGPAEIDQVAGDHHRVGALRQPQDLGHAALEHCGAVDHAIGKLARWLDVQIADLAEEERVAHRVSSAAWSTARCSRSPTANSRRSGVSTVTSCGPPQSTIRRVWSPRKKTDAMVPENCACAGGTMRVSSGRNSDSQAPPFRRTRFIVPMKSATN